MKQALPTYRKASKEPGSLPTILLDWQPYLMNIMGKGMLREQNAKQGRERFPLHFGDAQSAKDAKEHFMKLL